MYVHKEPPMHPAGPTVRYSTHFLLYVPYCSEANTSAPDQSDSPPPLCSLGDVAEVCGWSVHSNPQHQSSCPAGCQIFLWPTRWPGGTTQHLRPRDDTHLEDQQVHHKLELHGHMNRSGWHWHEYEGSNNVRLDCNQLIVIVQSRDTFWLKRSASPKEETVVFHNCI